VHDGKLVVCKEHDLGNTRRLKNAAAFDALAAGGKIADRFGDKTEPFEDCINTRLVILDLKVRHAVGNHNLRATELVLRVVHLSTKQFIQRRIACKNDRAGRLVNDSLSKTNEIGADSN
jgi:hypothetical protein